MSFKSLSLTIEITNQCNLRCRFCNIWQEAKAKYIEPVTLNNFLTTLVKDRGYNVQYIGITGGEPFLHPRFKALIKTIKLLKLKKILHQQIEVGIFSNGYFTREILSFLTDFSQEVENFNMGFSLDGIGDMHNQLRGKADAFKNVDRTINLIRKIFPRINIEIKSTISPVNYKDFLNIYAYCRKLGLNFSPKIVETNAKNYYQRNQSISPLAFSLADKSEIKKILKRIILSEEESNNKIVNIEILKALIIYFEEGNNIIKSCFTPRIALFITAQGNIYPCLYMPSIGNINDKDWDRSLDSNLYKTIIKRAQQADCPRCFAYHGFLRLINLYKIFNEFHHI